MKVSVEAAYLTLAKIKGVTYPVIKNVIERQGTVGDIFKTSVGELVSLGFNISSANEIHDSKISKATIDELKRLEKMGGKLLMIERADYPKLLKEIYDPPLFLYAYGNTDCLNENCISMVGARKTSVWGAKFAQKMAKDLAKVGFTVVSGLAYGIDINAHLGALDGDGATVAVLGSGLAKIYPPTHAKYIDEIIKKGCLLSESPLDEEPNKYNFPKRNRIISGLSLGVIIVEAAEKSGSLITTRLATEQGREVFAVPALPDSLNNATNKLIKNGAKLTESYLDIIEEFAHLLKKGDDTKVAGLTNQNIEFDSDEKKVVWESLSLEPQGVDELIISCKMGTIEVMTTVAELELDGVVEKGADGRYRII